MALAHASPAPPPRAVELQRAPTTRPPADAAQPRRTSRSGRNLAFVTRVNGPHKIGDLKLFEPKTMCPFMAVRDREER
jgi:hypothetical protein